MKSIIGKSVKFAFLGLIIAGGIAFCFRPVRAVLCENANICVYSCEEYSGKPIVAKIRSIYDPPLKCEEVEEARNYVFRQYFLDFLPAPKNEPCPEFGACKGE